MPEEIKAEVYKRLDARLERIVKSTFLNLRPHKCKNPDLEVLPNKSGYTLTSPGAQLILLKQVKQEQNICRH